MTFLQVFQMFNFTFQQCNKDNIAYFGNWHNYSLNSKINITNFIMNQSTYTLVPNSF